MKYEIRGDMQAVEGSSRKLKLMTSSTEMMLKKIGGQSILRANKVRS